MLEILSNGSKFCGEENDTIETLLDTLSKHSLDPVFEKYGNFVNRTPKWLNSKSAEKYQGCTSIHGNFMGVSHAFNIITDEPELIEKINSAINKNKQTPEYQRFRQELQARENKKEELRKLFEQGKIDIKQLYQY
jgi:hypothetical protein